MTTTTDTVSTARTLTENDVQRLTSALEVLHSLTKGETYDFGGKVGKVGISDHFQPNSGSQCAAIAQQALAAYKGYRSTQRKAAWAKMADVILTTMSPFIGGAMAARSALLALPPAALDMVKKSGALQDTVRVPLAFIAHNFPQGTTTEQMVDFCKSRGWSVVKGAEKGQLDVKVSLVPTETDKVLAPPTNQHTNPAPRRQATDTDIDATV